MNTYYSMVPKLVYAFRGWIAFVAFMDFGTMIRCFFEKRSHLGGHIYAVDGESQYDNPTLARIVGVYSLLKALALIHCTLYIHYKPVRSLGICALFITIVMYYAETFYFYTTALSFYILFPCVLNAITLVGLLLIPKYLEPPVVAEDENMELLKQAAAMRKRRAKKNA